MKKILLLCLLAAPAAADYQLVPVRHGQDGYLTECIPLYDLAENGATTLSGVSGATSGFTISIKADNESTWTDFSGGNIQTIATNGTWSSPSTNTQIRFDECESEGAYELQFHNDHLDKLNARSLTVKMGDGGTLMGDQFVTIDLTKVTLTEVGTALGDELTAYDGPTNNELDAALAAGVSVSELQAAALAHLFSVDSGTDYASAVSGSVVKEIADNAAGTGGGGSDPWAEPLPGSYGSGEAGFILDAISDAVLTGGVAIGAAGAEAVWSHVIEPNGSVTAECWAAMVNAILLGVYTQDGEGNVTAKDQTGAVNRTTAVLTANGRNTITFSCP